MENIGSIAKIWYAFVDDISYFAAWKGVVSYALKQDKDFIEIPASLKKCEITCEPESTEHGTLYKPQVKLYVPFSTVQIADENWWRFPYCGVILKYKMNSGEGKILGTLDNPLAGTCTEIDPPNPSDWKGWLISLSGQQLHKQLLVKQ
jgi:hypothetical protein